MFWSPAEASVAAATGIERWRVGHCGAPVTPESPIRALRAAPGHTLFEFMAEVALTEDDQDAEVALVVVANAQPGKLPKSIKRATALSPGVWERLRSGEAFLVLDASSEGAQADPGVVEELHGLLSGRGVAPGRTIYVTQDRLFDAEYRRLCAAQGLSPALSVLTFDYWIRALLESYATRGPAIHQRRLEAYRARGDRRSRRFLSLNLTLRNSKLAFLASAMRDGLWEAGHISFGGFERRATKGKSEDVIREGFQTDPDFGALGQTLSAEFERLAALDEILLGGGAGSRTGDGRPKFTDDADLPEYGDSWFSVITETEMHRVPTRITEKPFKPIANFHPFMVLGNPGALGFLRRLGFQTFAGLFDEAYDDEPDPRRRFELIYSQFAALCRLDEATLAGRVAEVSEAVEFNARHLLIGLPARFRQTIDRPFMTSLRAIVDRA